jgi:hypothetical protein
MRRLAGILVLFVAAAPAWAAKKITVEQLKDTLISLEQAKKSDVDVATQLKQVELTEQLTPKGKDSLAPHVPGPLAAGELNILEGRSAVLAPPASELPATPAPNVATQRAILGKTVSYVTKVYMQNPHLTADKTTTRYQDGVNDIRTNSGMTSNMPNVDRAWATPNIFMRLLGSHTEPVESEKGIEKAGGPKVKAQWGQNGQVSEGGPGPILSVILQEAAAGGKLGWLRWETLDGRDVAVFSFSVDKKNSHYEVNYCCFPVTEDAGRMWEVAEPNMQTGTTWKAFKETVSYRGEFFIDPDSGAIVRIVTQADLKPTYFVHQEDMRIDYGPVTVDGARYFVPLRNITLTEVVPNGDNYAARYSIRHTLFDATYKNYQMAH